MTSGVGFDSLGRAAVSATISVLTALLTSWRYIGMVVNVVVPQRALGLKGLALAALAALFGHVAGFRAGGIIGRYHLIKVVTRMEDGHIPIGSAADSALVGLDAIGGAGGLLKHGPLATPGVLGRGNGPLVDLLVAGGAFLVGGAGMAAGGLRPMLHIVVAQGRGVHDVDLLAADGAVVIAAAGVLAGRGGGGMDVVMVAGGRAVEGGLHSLSALAGEDLGAVGITGGLLGDLPLTNVDVVTAATGAARLIAAGFLGLGGGGGHVSLGGFRSLGRRCGGLRRRCGGLGRFRLGGLGGLGGLGSRGGFRLSGLRGLGGLGGCGGFRLGGFRGLGGFRRLGGFRGLRGLGSLGPLGSLIGLGRLGGLGPLGFGGFRLGDLSDGRLGRGGLGFRSLGLGRLGYRSLRVGDLGLGGLRDRGLGFFLRRLTGQDAHPPCTGTLGCVSADVAAGGLGNDPVSTCGFPSGISGDAGQGDSDCGDCQNGCQGETKDTTELFHVNVPP